MYKNTINKKIKFVLKYVIANLVLFLSLLQIYQSYDISISTPLLSEKNLYCREISKKCKELQSKKQYQEILKLTKKLSKELCQRNTELSICEETAYFELGKNQLEKRNYPDALKFFKNVKNPEVMFYIGNIYVKQGQWKGAIKSLGEFLDSKPTKNKIDEARYLKGFCHYKLDEKEKSLEELEKIKSDATQYSNAQYYVGKIKYEQQKYKEAISAFSNTIDYKKHFTVTDNITDVWLYKGKSEYEFGQAMYKELGKSMYELDKVEYDPKKLKEKINRLKDSLASFKNVTVTNQDILFYSGKAEYELGKSLYVLNDAITIENGDKRKRILWRDCFSAALNFFEGALKKPENAKSREIKRMKMQTLYYLENYPDVSNWLTEAEMIDPDAVDTFIYLGFICDSKCQRAGPSGCRRNAYYDNAIKLFEMAKDKMNADSAEIDNYMGIIQYNKHLNDDALASFENALRTEETYYEARYNKGIVYKRMEEDAKKVGDKDAEENAKTNADNVFEQIINNQQIPAEAKGDAYYYLLNYTKAQDNYEKSLASNLKRHDPRSLWNKLAVIYFRLGKKKEALDFLGKVTKDTNKQDGIFVKAWNNIGIIKYDKSKYEKGYLRAAIKAFEQAGKGKDSGYQDSDKALTVQGHIYYSLGKYASSEQAFENATDMNHENDEAWYGKGLAQIALRKYANALESFHQAAYLKRENSDYAIWLAYSRFLDLEDHRKIEKVSQNNLENSQSYKEGLFYIISELDKSGKAMEKNSYDKAKIDYYLGYFYLKYGNISKSQNKLESSVPIFRKIKEARGEILDLTQNIASILLESKKKIENQDVLIPSNTISKVKKELSTLEELVKKYSENILISNYNNLEQNTKEDKDYQSIEKYKKTLENNLSILKKTQARKEGDAYLNKLNESIFILQEIQKEADDKYDTAKQEFTRAKELLAYVWNHKVSPSPYTWWLFSPKSLHEKYWRVSKMTVFILSHVILLTCLIIYLWPILLSIDFFHSFCSRIYNRTCLRVFLKWLYCCLLSHCHRPPKSFGKQKIKNFSLFRRKIGLADMAFIVILFLLLISFPKIKKFAIQDSSFEFETTQVYEPKIAVLAIDKFLTIVPDIEEMLW